MKENQKLEILAIAQQAISTEVEDLARMPALLDSALRRAVSLSRDRKGRVNFEQRIIDVLNTY